jgi:hypothetical protein
MKYPAGKRESGNRALGFMLRLPYTELVPRSPLLVSLNASDGVDAIMELGGSVAKRDPRIDMSDEQCYRSRLLMPLVFVRCLSNQRGPSSLSNTLSRPTRPC